MVAKGKNDRFEDEQRSAAPTQNNADVANRLQPGHRAPLRPELRASFERTFAKLEPGLRYLADR